jgi:hypothetical protein
MGPVFNRKVKLIFGRSTLTKSLFIDLRVVAEAVIITTKPIRTCNKGAAAERPSFWTAAWIAAIDLSSKISCPVRYSVTPRARCTASLF